MFLFAFQLYMIHESRRVRSEKAPQMRRNPQIFMEVIAVLVLIMKHRVSKSHIYNLISNCKMSKPSDQE